MIATLERLEETLNFDPLNSSLFKIICVKAERTREVKAKANLERKVQSWKWWFWHYRGFNVNSKICLTSLNNTYYFEPNLLLCQETFLMFTTTQHRYNTLQLLQLLQIKNGVIRWTCFECLKKCVFDNMALYYSAELTHDSFRLFFWRFCPLGRYSLVIVYFCFL